MPRTQTTTRLPLRHLPGTVLLVLALLWAQLLGLAHGVLHSHDPQAPAVAQVQEHDHAHAAHGGLSQLLAHAAGDSECRLYDQLGQGGPVAVSHIALPTALPLLPAWVVLKALQPRPCVAFAARAPPASR
ncbi:MAG: hypothetical protein O9318_07415 [Hylemonella sp.]|uniref:hypothetical protein n=1 Tax=Hylemonella sp. TaxID=2066020 RepID=UPI0022CAED5C|nr:hypothetical protein [Hylemonella sp.]MCZ8252282.1 hypothetical protein [Hylemonella sp.]